MSFERIDLENAPLEIIDGDRGSNYPKMKEFFENEHCLFLNAGNVTTSGFIFEQNQFITKGKDELLRKGKLKRGDIVITTRGTLGNIGYYSDKIVYEDIRINSGMVILRIGEKSALDQLYTYYSLRDYYFQQQISSTRSGSAQPQIPIGTLKKLKIYIPPLPTQRKIASVLSAYDDLIENNLRRIKLLEEAARNIYKEWFINFHFPDHEKTKFVNGLPDGWEKKTIEEVSDIAGGGTPSTKVPSYWSNGNILWFTPSDLTKNKSYVILDSATKITEEGLARSSAKVIPYGSIMLSSRATIGYLAIIDSPYTTNQGFINITPNLSYLKSYLLFNFMNRIEEFINKAHGSTYKEITKGTFRFLEVIVPSKELLSTFEQQVSVINKQIKTLLQQNQKLKQARDLLLPRLMSGEVEV